jgi:glycolate oxidase
MMRSLESVSHGTVCFNAVKKLRAFVRGDSRVRARAAMSSLDRVLVAIERDCGSGSVVTDPDVRRAYAIDESEATPRTPDAVVRVRGTRDVAAVLRAASAHEVPVTPRGGGTGRTGGAVPVAGGIVLSFERMAALKDIERDNLVAVAEPGIVTGTLREAVEAEGLFYAPDPNSLASCALGGNVAENAGGPCTLRYGPTRDWVLGLEIVTAEGQVLRLGKRTAKGVTGYDLTSLVVGSEGTLGVVTEVTLKLVPKPEAIATLLALMPDLPAAGRAVTAMLGRGLLPRCLELLDEETLAVVRPDAALPLDARARALLLVELDGDLGTLDAQTERAGNALAESGALDVLLARHGGERERLWSARRELTRSLRKLATHKLSEDVVVPRARIPDLIDACTRIAERERVRMPSYGHAGDGNIHVNFLWNDADDRPRVDRAIEALFRETIALGGTLSGEHGIGILKASFLPLEQAPELIALQERVKTAFDPKGILNPGKIFPAHVRRFHGAC